MKKINLKEKVTKFYEDHKTGVVIAAGIIGGAVGIAIGEKIVEDKYQNDFDTFESEKIVSKNTTDVSFFYNDGEPMGFVRDLSADDPCSCMIKNGFNVTDDTAILGVKCFYKNN